MESPDWFALLEGLGKQNKWTLTLEVPTITLSFVDAELWMDLVFWATHLIVLI